ncbi:hypothetical protein COT44_00925 [Candidatus Shapirobacteria bacterium CG08_land_8_20_14_0_20_39_18]|uniref:Glycosyltransferase 2-like domain-containing protein n=1 Tax=Candidatus Shapirobacteria bacterium CG08_land_8_20_14_0_20_39_18 TaxID=1974883 RepID=A0A2M6XDT5_9BACT|nr:MAG: hypothetical protein COT44_00925 [Candidatus Shapirobacteria bacterium CG08_land_8_20_14_0_20_39_18]PJE68613.1 MAG: hypothetical protein COU94_01000 [Candidatus Shapirobacteria bacterium CG10_big_fil_rev_8_21_14_0_10_38_8]
MKKNTLSVALAVYNEEKFLEICLKSVQEIADEINIVDGGSTDKTVEIAKSFKAKIQITDNPKIFHINKQKALEMCKGDWILQLDADEVVTKELGEEVVKVISLSREQLEIYQQNLPKRQLFLRHQKLLEKRDGQIGETNGDYAGFFLPRKNYFLGKYLKYGGVYPDGVIRLVKNGRAKFPCKSVHEQIVVNGRVGWLENDLIHLADADFKRYLSRNSHYIDLLTEELRSEKVPISLFQAINYFILKPTGWFLITQIRHKGILDGYQGIVFSLFSALRFPRAYFRYLKKEHEK